MLLLYWCNPSAYKTMCADLLSEPHRGQHGERKAQDVEERKSHKALSAVKASPEARTKVVNVARATYRERGG